MTVIRELSDGFRQEIQKPASGEVILTFLTITNPDSSIALSVVTEGDGVVSHANGKIINYRLDGILYLGFPFGFSMLGDGDRVTEARLNIPNVDRRIGRAIDNLTSAPHCRMRTTRASEFEPYYDDENARNPVDTPTIEINANYLFLRDIQGDAMTLSGRLIGVDFGAEPFPYYRATQQRTPGLWRR